jgi:serine/threonine protein phosphatase PrpC
VHLSGDRLFCCNVGDSRAIMGRRQLMNRYIPIKLNKIHKPIGPEKERIIRCGGRVECVTGNL